MPDAITTDESHQKEDKEQKASEVRWVCFSAVMVCPDDPLAR
jgi:hypothetical protein